MNRFVLHNRLREDTAFVADLKLCSVLLMKDATMPWLILVPRVPCAREVFDLDDSNRHLLMDELTFASKAVERLYKPDKINIGALGNIVEQLHIHVIARFKKDRAWPGPAWGKDGARPYTAGALEAELKRLKYAFSAFSA